METATQETDRGAVVKADQKMVDNVAAILSAPEIQNIINNKPNEITADPAAGPAAPLPADAPAPLPADAPALEVKGEAAPAPAPALEVKGEGEDKGVKPVLQDAQTDVDNNAPEKMYDIDGVPGTDAEKHIFKNLGEVNAARLLADSEPLAELKTGGRRRSTRRRHKKSSKKSRRQSKKGGKKHRKRTSKKGGKGKKRSQRKH